MSNWTPVTQAPLPKLTIMQCRFRDGSEASHCLVSDAGFVVDGVEKGRAHTANVTHWRINTRRLWARPVPLLLALALAPQEPTP